LRQVLGKGHAALTKQDLSRSPAALQRSVKAQVLRVFSAGGTWACAGPALAPRRSSLSLLRAPEHIMAATSRVESLMSTALVTVQDTDSVAAAEIAMKLASVRHVPVVDAKQNLVGILSVRDVLEALARGKKQVLVGEYMTRNVVTVTPETPVHRAIDLLLEHEFGSLPVVGADGHLVGIVTETDLVRRARAALAQQP
ncbi:MAG TPA: CBS domain-containing protein, partial [Anaeromyxobacteraceae bacterium]|nr:CBS domain-containing protein [Anaeromyxobacteraceae bacterium]